MCQITEVITSSWTGAWWLVQHNVSFSLSMSLSLTYIIIMLELNWHCINIHWLLDLSFSLFFLVLIDTLIYTCVDRGQRRVFRNVTLYHELFEPLRNAITLVALAHRHTWAASVLIFFSHFLQRKILKEDFRNAWFDHVQVFLSLGRLMIKLPV